MNFEKEIVSENPVQPDDFMNPPDSGNEWSTIKIPANPGDENVWELQEEVSDDFNYTFESVTSETTIEGKWTNFYHNGWDGPSPSKWVHENVEVSDGVLKLKATRVEGETKVGSCNGVTTNLPATRMGCITSTKRIIYLVFVETRVKVTNAYMASDIWMLSPDDTQEIDVLEAYGHKTAENDWYAQRLHISHHVFIRNLFQDYQPKDQSTWYTGDETTYWSDHWLRIGVYWKSPTHLEYYVNGELIKISDNLDTVGDKDGIDPLNYTSPDGKAATRTGLNKEMDIIINIEDQTWNACAGRTPSNEDIKDTEKHTFKVDWIRVYKLEKKSD